MFKIVKFLMVLLLVTITSLTCQVAEAAHGGGGGGAAFSFTYNVGTAVTNYHAYNLVKQVGCGGTNQPAGTVILGLWYVTDLGLVTGTGTVNVTAPTCPTGKSQNVAGAVFFADASDVGGDGSGFVHAHPVADVRQFLPNWYGGADFVGIIEPDNTGITLYFGPPFTPFSWDLSAYLY